MNFGTGPELASIHDRLWGSGEPENLRKPRRREVYPLANACQVKLALCYESRTLFLVRIVEQEGGDLILRHRRALPTESKPKLD